MKNTSKKIRINVTIDWPEGKSVIESGKANEIKSAIREDVGQLTNEALAEFNPSDIKVRFLRN